MLTSQKRSNLHWFILASQWSKLRYLQEKAAGEKSVGEKSVGEKAAGEKSVGEKSGGG